MGFGRVAWSHSSSRHVLSTGLLPGDLGLGDISGIDLGSSDERTIRLLQAEVSLLRKRTAQSDKCTHRIEALAEAATARLTEEGVFSAKRSLCSASA
jgi:hypothetical protein